MTRKTRWAVAALVLLPLLAVGGAVLWLGPRAAWWTVVAWVRPAGPDAAWRHVPDDAPVLVVVEPGKLLASPVARAVRPRLAELASLHGVDLVVAESGITHAVGAFHGTGEGFLVGAGAGLSPSLLPRLDPRWRAETVAGVRGATDGQVFLGEIATGVMLASRQDFAGEAVSQARAAAREGSGAIRLPLDGPALSLRAEVVPDRALRREMEYYLPREGDYLAEDVVRASADVAAGTTLDLSLSVEHRTEASAARTESLLLQLDAAAKLARQLGPLAKILLKGDAALVTEVPPLTIRRDGSVVSLSLEVAQDQLERWLDILLERSRAMLAPRPR